MRIKFANRELIIFDKSALKVLDSREVERTGTYTVKAPVSDKVINCLCDKLRGAEPDVTSDLCDGLRSISSELGYDGFDEDLHLFGQGPGGVVSDELEETRDNMDELSNLYRQLQEKIDENQKRAQEDMRELRETLDKVKDACLEKIGDVARDMERLRQEIKEIRKEMRRGQFAAGPGGGAKLQSIVQKAKSSDPFDGIFAFMSTQVNGNLCDAGVVEVTASPSVSAKHDPKYLLEESGTYISKPEPGAFFCIDFKDKLVVIEGYTLKSCPGTGASYFHLKSWVLEASYDGDDWVELDRRENNNDLNGPSKLQVFDITEKQDEPLRYVRLRQIGPNHYKDQSKDSVNKLTCARVELFGSLYVNTAHK